jgi:hypothetical protein
MRGWDCAGLAQTEGSESFSSRMASWERRRGESKILPQAADFFADGSVGELEIRQHA